MNIEVDNDMDVKSAKSSRQSLASVDVTVNLKVAELKRLREKCNLLEDSECSLKSQLATLKMKCEDKEEEIVKVNRDHLLCKDDLDTYIAKTNVSLLSGVDLFTLKNFLFETAFLGLI